MKIKDLIEMLSKIDPNATINDIYERSYHKENYTITIYVIENSNKDDTEYDESYYDINYQENSCNKRESYHIVTSDWPDCR